MLKVSNIEMLGLESSIVASVYPVLKKPYTEEEFKQKKKEVHNILFDELEEKTDWAEKRVKRAQLLGSVPTGTAHDNFLKGIIVQFDITYSVYWTPQFQRYHFADIISSTSSMYTLTKIDLNDAVNEYVLPQTKDHIVQLIEVYNDALSQGNKTVSKIIKYKSMGKIETIRFSSKTNGIMKLPEEIVTEIPIEDLYMYIISSCPQGLEKTMRVSTNYLQLKTMWHQRRHHKLKDWQVFCDEIEKLPYFKELTGCGL